MEIKRHSAEGLVTKQNEGDKRTQVTPSLGNLLAISFVERRTMEKRRFPSGEGEESDELCLEWVEVRGLRDSKKRSRIGIIMRISN